MSVPINLLWLVTPIDPSGIVLPHPLDPPFSPSVCAHRFFYFIFAFPTICYVFYIVSPPLTNVSLCSGSGAAMDVVVSSVRAYLSALNKMSSYVGAIKASSEAPETISVQTTEWAFTLHFCSVISSLEQCEIPGGVFKIWYYMSVKSCLVV